jgi:hypothetical protein
VFAQLDPASASCCQAAVGGYVRQSERFVVHKTEGVKVRDDSTRTIMMLVEE